MKRILRIALIVFVSLTLFSCKAKKEERDDIYIFLRAMCTAVSKKTSVLLR